MGSTLNFYEYKNHKKSQILHIGPKSIFRTLFLALLLTHRHKYNTQPSNKPHRSRFVVLKEGRKKNRVRASHTTNLDKVRQDGFLVPEDQRCRATQMNMVTQFREGAEAQHMAPEEGHRDGA